MGKYDFILIDGLLEEEFTRGYCKRLLSNRKKKTVVAIHNIVNTRTGGSKESSEVVYKYIALDNKVHNVFTMSPFAMPSMLYDKRALEIVPKLNKMRANLGIVKKCTEGCDGILNNVRANLGIPIECTDYSCGSALHDALYFKNGDATTIFFEIN